MTVVSATQNTFHELASDLDMHASLLIYLLSEVRYRRLRIDLDVLRDLAERLSGPLIIAYIFNSQGGVLHNVVIPWSWLINFILPGTDL